MQTPRAQDALTRKQGRMIADALSRHGRRKTGLFLCDGVRVCREALRFRPDWIELFILSTSFAATVDAQALLAALESGECVVLPDAAFDRVAPTVTPQGVLLVLRRQPGVPAVGRSDPLVLVLDRVADPGNMGTILRTAWAVGLHEVWLTAGSADPFGPKAIRAGMGAQFALQLPVLPALADVREALSARGIRRFYLTVPAGGVSCFTDGFEPRESALVIGNEARGADISVSDARLTIPMPGAAESLNAAQAATVILFEAVRRGVLQA